ncbi:hypothetical protein ACLB2K_064538 [Fragaria x ananassa]
MSLSTQRASSPSLSWAEPPHRWKYDVFLSFRGQDTRWGFISHLYHQLKFCQLFKTFKDDRELEIGSEISSKLLSAIEHSHLAIVVLSPDYASSPWCLDELAKIIESMEPGDKRILPVFFDMGPSDVEHQRKSFAKAFAKHEVKFSDDPKKVERWRHALRKVANLSGWVKENYKCERELTDVIVKSVWEKLRPTITLPNSEEKLVGMDFRLGQMGLLLALEEKDVRFIGIWGMGGVGKTTLAKLVYEKILHHFEVAEFLVDVRKSHSQLVNLQKQVLFPVLKENVLQVWDEYKGTLLFRKCMSNKKVLLVVDDVDCCDLLKKLAGHKSWFGEGSRIIVTSRDERVLIENDIEISFKLSGLNDCEALELFCQNALKKDLPEEGFLELSKCFIDYVEGLPLALKIVGSSLYNRDLETWESAWDRLKKGSNATVFNSLKISYDALDYMEKNIFLDVAFFHRGITKARVIELLKSCGLSGRYGIGVLIEKSLVTIDTYNNIGMHGLIQDMAEEIVRQETPDSREEPGLRSRLLHRNDIFHVFTTNTDLPKLKRMDLSVSKYLKKSPDFTGMADLEDLDLKYCESLVEVHPSIAVHKKLKRLILQGCKNVKSFPSKIEIDSLEFLDLSYCSKLKIPEFGEGMKKLSDLYMPSTASEELPSSIEHLVSLECLDIDESKSLQSIPGTTIFKLKSLEVLIMSGCPKLKKLVGNTEETECLKPFMRSKLGSFFRRKSLEPMLPSPRALPSLRYLYLTDCHLRQGVLPDDIGYCFQSLHKLRLSGNDFITLPASIKCLYKLRFIDLRGCKRLQQLPDLPSNRDLEVWADDCDSLKKLSEPSQQGTSSNLAFFRLRTVNCFGLINNEGFTDGIFSMLRRLAAQGISPDFFSFDIVSPGSRISEWFDIRREGGSLTVEMPLDRKNCKSEWMGIVFCVVFADQIEPHTLECNDFLIEDLSPGVLKHIYRLTDMRHMMGDHLWVSFMPRGLIQETTSCLRRSNFDLQSGTLEIIDDVDETKLEELKVVFLEFTKKQDPSNDTTFCCCFWTSKKKEGTSSHVAQLNDHSEHLSIRNNNANKANNKSEKDGGKNQPEANHHHHHQQKQEQHPDANSKGKGTMGEGGKGNQQRKEIILGGMNQNVNNQSEKGWWKGPNKG